jgi:hypothetical protein
MNKQQMDLMIEKIINDWCPATEHYTPSKKFQDELQLLGINLKLYYNYKLPENISPADLEKQVTAFGFLANSKNMDSLDLEELGISPEYRRQLGDHILKQVPIYKVKLLTLVNDIKSLNPNLAHIDTSKNPLEFLRGVTSGYPPSDIDFWVNHYFPKMIGYDDDRKKYPADYEVFCEMLKKDFGLQVFWVLSPETRNMILTALRTRMPYINQATDNYYG